MLKIEPIDDPSKSTRNGLFTISGVSIPPINHHNTKENTTITINFTVDVSGANTITVDAFFSNDYLIPDDHLSFSASNSNSVTQSVNQSSMAYTLTLNPLQDQWGTSIITISANISNGFNDSTSFELSVNNPPVLSICSYMMASGSYIGWMKQMMQEMFVGGRLRIMEISSSLTFDEGMEAVISFRV